MPTPSRWRRWWRLPAGHVAIVARLNRLIRSCGKPNRRMTSLRMTSLRTSHRRHRYRRGTNRRATTRGQSRSASFLVIPRGSLGIPGTNDVLPAVSIRDAMDPPCPGVIRGKLPGKQVPQLASVDGGTVRLLTRNGNDWTGRLPAVTKAISRLDVDDATADANSLRSITMEFPVSRRCRRRCRMAGMRFGLFARGLPRR